MTIMGWTVSDECADYVNKVTEKLSKRVLFSNEPLDGEKSKIQTINQNLYYIYFDMNRIDIGDEFESLIKKEMDHAFSIDQRL